MREKRVWGSTFALLERSSEDIGKREFSAEIQYAQAPSGNFKGDALSRDIKLLALEATVAARTRGS